LTVRGSESVACARYNNKVLSAGIRLGGKSGNGFLVILF